MSIITNILKPVDIEEEIRLALTDYMTVFCRPLPEKFQTPCLLVVATGGTSNNKVDTFTVSLDARSESNAEAYDLLAKALGILEQQARNQTGALRNVIINGLARWGTDPVRPDLNLCTATVLVTAHREEYTVPEES